MQAPRCPPVADEAARQSAQDLAGNPTRRRLPEEHDRRGDRYGLGRWDGLVRFLDDGRIEIDSNIVERAIRPVALNRKNALFAGSGGGREHWATLASLIETSKLNGIDRHAYLADIPARIANGHPINKIDELPWAIYPLYPEAYQAQGRSDRSKCIAHVW